MRFGFWTTTRMCATLMKQEVHQNSYIRDCHNCCPHLVFSNKTLSPRSINKSPFCVFPLNGTVTEWISIRNAWNVWNTILWCFVVLQTQTLVYYCVYHICVFTFSYWSNQSSLCSVILRCIKTTAHSIEGMFRIMTRSVRRPCNVMFGHSKYQYCYNGRRGDRRERERDKRENFITFTSFMA